MISERRFREQLRPALPYFDQALDDLNCPHDSRGEELLDLITSLFRVVVIEGSQVAECGMIRLESTTEPGDEVISFEISVVSTMAYFEERQPPLFRLYPSFDNGSVCRECGQIKKGDT